MLDSDKKKKKSNWRIVRLQRTRFFGLMKPRNFLLSVLSSMSGGNQTLLITCSGRLRDIYREQSRDILYRGGRWPYNHTTKPTQESLSNSSECPRVALTWTQSNISWKTWERLLTNCRRLTWQSLRGSRRKIPKSRCERLVVLHWRAKADIFHQQTPSDVSKHFRHSGSFSFLIHLQTRSSLSLSWWCQVRTGSVKPRHNRTETASVLNTLRA